MRRAVPLAIALLASSTASAGYSITAPKGWTRDKAAEDKRAARTVQQFGGEGTTAEAQVWHAKPEGGVPSMEVVSIVSAGKGDIDIVDLLNTMAAAAEESAKKLGLTKLPMKAPKQKGQVVTLVAYVGTGVYQRLESHAMRGKNNELLMLTVSCRDAVATTCDKAMATMKLTK